MRYHLAAVRKAIINNKKPQALENVQKREHSHTIGGNTNCSHHGKRYGGSSKKKRRRRRIELPYDPAIHLPNIYLKNMKMLICKDMFTAASRHGNNLSP